MLIRSSILLKLGLAGILLLVHICEPNPNLVHRQFRYKYSFKPPFLAQKDGSVPFWTYGGNAIASGEMVRLAPSLKSQKGAIWTKVQTDFEWWEVDIVFRISGRGRIGADGMAFWYTTSQGDYNGNVFGSSDKWNGLGLFFDSFDNDGAHNNPYIMAVVNDGTREFDHQNDGKTQSLSGCLKDFRNKPFPIRAKIEYYKNILTVLFHNGLTQNDQDYEMCLRAENVFLPKHGYFGISAATGGLADDHDVYHFLTTALYPAEMVKDASKLQESEKLTKEYQEYQRKLDQQKEEYKKEHPDEQKDEFDDWFETDNQRELRQIWQAQSQTTEVLRELSRKLDEVLGRQERTLGLLSVGGGGGQIQHQQPPQASGGYNSGGYTVTRQDVDLLIQNQNQLSATVRDITMLVQDVQGKTNNLLNRGTASVQTGSYQDGPLVTEMREGINSLRNQLAQMGVGGGQAQAQTGGCPDQKCLGLTPFLIAIVVQLVIILGYNLYRDSREAQAKKFY